MVSTPNSGGADCANRRNCSPETRGAVGFTISWVVGVKKKCSFGSGIMPTDEERAHHGVEGPKDTMPPKEKPACNRDGRLPKGPV